MRTKIDYRSGSKETYNNFCKRHPHIRISFSKYYEVINTCNKMFAEEILNTGEKVKLPWGFGDLSVNKKMGKNVVTVRGQTHIVLPIDWKKSKEKGKKIYIMNDHTHGYRFRWYWFKRTALFARAKEIWIFKPCRFISRKLAENLKKNESYFDIYKEWVP